MSVPKPPSLYYPTELRTIGDHLYKVRLDRGLSKQEVAESLGVEVSTVVGWEKGRKRPRVWYLPRITALLGYDPFPKGASLGERLRAERQRRGLTQHQLARLLHTTQALVSLLETGGEVRNARVFAAVERFVEGEE